MGKAEMTLDEAEMTLDAGEGLVDHLVLPLLAAAVGLGAGLCLAAFLAWQAAAPLAATLLQ